MRTVFFVVEDQIPILMFPTLEAAQRFCAKQPDLQVREFAVPAVGAEREEIKQNLKDSYAFRQSLRGEPVIIDNQVYTLDAIAEMRCSMHREFLENLHAHMKGAVTPMPGQCPNPACPGRMVEGMVSLK